MVSHWTPALCLLVCLTQASGHSQVYQAWLADNGNKSLLVVNAIPKFLLESTIFGRLLGLRDTNIGDGKTVPAAAAGDGGDQSGVRVIEKSHNAAVYPAAAGAARGASAKGSVRQQRPRQAAAGLATLTLWKQALVDAFVAKLNQITGNDATQQTQNVPSPMSTPAPSPIPESAPSLESAPEPAPSLESAPEPAPALESAPEPESSPESTPEPESAPESAPVLGSAQGPASAPEPGPAPESAPEVAPESGPEPTSASESAPAQELASESAPAQESALELESVPAPESAPVPASVPAPPPQPSSEAAPQSMVAPAPASPQQRPGMEPTLAPSTVSSAATVAGEAQSSASPAADDITSSPMVAEPAVDESVKTGLFHPDTEISYYNGASMSAPIAEAQILETHEESNAEGDRAEEETNTEEKTETVEEGMDTAEEGGDTAEKDMNETEEIMNALEEKKSTANQGADTAEDEIGATEKKMDAAEEGSVVVEEEINTVEEGMYAAEEKSTTGEGKYTVEEGVSTTGEEKTTVEDGTNTDEKGTNMAEEEAIAEEEDKITPEQGTDRVDQETDTTEEETGTIEGDAETIKEETDTIQEMDTAEGEMETAEEETKTAGEGHIMAEEETGTVEEMGTGMHDAAEMSEADSMKGTPKESLPGNQSEMEHHSDDRIAYSEQEHSAKDEEAGESDVSDVAPIQQPVEEAGADNMTMEDQLRREIVETAAQLAQNYTAEDDAAFGKLLAMFATIIRPDSISREPWSPDPEAPTEDGSAAEEDRSAERPAVGHQHAVYQEHPAAEENPMNIMTSGDPSQASSGSHAADLNSGGTEPSLANVSRELVREDSVPGKAEVTEATETAASEGGPGETEEIAPDALFPARYPQARHALGTVVRAELPAGTADVDGSQGIGFKPPPASRMAPIEFKPTAVIDGGHFDPAEYGLVRNTSLSSRALDGTATRSLQLRDSLAEAAAVAQAGLSVVRPDWRQPGVLVTPLHRPVKPDTLCYLLVKRGACRCTRRNCSKFRKFMQHKCPGMCDEEAAARRSSATDRPQSRIFSSVRLPEPALGILSKCRGTAALVPTCRGDRPYVAHPIFCECYWVCHGQNAGLTACPNGEHFSTSSKEPRVCVPFEKSQCRTWSRLLVRN